MAGSDGDLVPPAGGKAVDSDLVHLQGMIHEVLKTVARSEASVTKGEQNNTLEQQRAMIQLLRQESKSLKRRLREKEKIIDELRTALSMETGSSELKPGATPGRNSAKSSGAAAGSYTRTGISRSKSGANNEPTPPPNKPNPVSTRNSMVRCPSCSTVLIVPPNSGVIRCGNCDTHMRAPTTVSADTTASGTVRSNSGPVSGAVPPPAKRSRVEPTGPGPTAGPSPATGSGETGASAGPTSPATKRGGDRMPGTEASAVGVEPSPQNASAGAPTSEQAGSGAQ